MNNLERPTRWMPCLLLAAALVATGCSPKHVEVLGVSGPDSLMTDQPGTFEATTNEDAKQPIAYRWDFMDNTTGEGNPVTHVYQRPGTYTVMLRASNRKGKSTDTGQTTVYVYPPPVPAQVMTILADPQDPDDRTEVRFGANVRGDAPVRYSWTFGDGASSNDTAPLHLYDQPGTYTVTLTATNDAGADQRTLLLTVLPYEADYCADLAEMNAVYFERNSSVLSQQAIAALRDNLNIMQDCPNMSAHIEGLAGPFERNPENLSEDRARAAQQYYITNGVAASRITFAGKGRAGLGAKKSGGDLYQRADSIPVHDRGDDM